MTLNAGGLSVLPETDPHEVRFETGRIAETGASFAVPAKRQGRDRDPDDLPRETRRQEPGASRPARTPAFVLAADMLCACMLASCAPEASEARPPNILWIVLEDTAPLMGVYGTTLIDTPHIDGLAARGTRYTNVFMPSPVCSPSRSAIITGSMATTLGLHNHHSSRTEESAIFLPEGYKTVPELLNENGYFSFNNGKDDYNFHYDRRSIYDQSYSQHPLYGKRGDPVDLATLESRQPFFGQVQLRGGKEIFSPTFEQSVEQPVNRELIELPPYLPDHPAIVEEYADHLDAIQITDRRVGEILDQLRAANVLDETVVFFFSDHGMRLTRNKQFLYDGGLHVPLLVADYRDVSNGGAVDDHLISGIDLGTSTLSLAGVDIPEEMEGADIFDPSFAGRAHVISTRDRCDFTIDRIRSVRSKQFKYIRNFLTDRPWAQPTYMDVDRVEFVRVMRQLHADGQLNDTQARFFSAERPAEELYDLQADPFELNNLANTAGFEDVVADYSSILDNWITETGDRGALPEDEAGLMLMLGIWGEHAVNPEYAPLLEEYGTLPGSQWELKSASWASVDP